MWDAFTGREVSSRRSLFAGAQVNRLTADWISSPMVSGRRELAELPTLRARSRQLARDSACIRRYLGLREENVVGPQGIALQMRTSDQALNAAVEAWWVSLAESTDLDPLGQRDLHELAREADRLRAMDGEAFYRWRRGRGALGLLLQSLDADQVDIGYDRLPEGSRAEIRQGIEIDALGRPLAYHVYDGHPDEVTAGRPRERVRIPAADVLHIWHRARPGQTRGLPDVYAVLLPLKMLDGYEEAALVAARAGAHKLGFIIDESDTADGLGLLGEATATALPTDSAPGEWMKLDPGLKVQQYDPAFPNIAHEQFTKAFRRNIAIGLGVSYHALFGDLEAVNFSSGRIGDQQMRDNWRLWQQRLVRTFYRPVFARTLEVALAMGMIPGVRVARLDEILAGQTWRPRGWSPVDPVKEQTARSSALAMGLTTFSDEAAAEGRDFEDNLTRLAAEYAKAREMGVTLLASLPVNSTPSPTATEEPVNVE